LQITFRDVLAVGKIKQFFNVAVSVWNVHHWHSELTFCW